MKFTLIFALFCLVALTYAVPSPPKRLFKRAAPPSAAENVDDLKESATDEKEKDLEGSESAYHGYYGWPGYYSPYSYYSRVYHGYYPYAYSPYSYWW